MRQGRGQLAGARSGMNRSPMTNTKRAVILICVGGKGRRSKLTDNGWLTSAWELRGEPPRLYVPMWLVPSDRSTSRCNFHSQLARQADIQRSDLLRVVESSVSIPHYSKVSYIACGARRPTRMRHAAHSPVHENCTSANGVCSSGQFLLCAVFYMRLVDCSLHWK